MADYQRPQEGFRFYWGGIKLNSTPDACKPNKFPSAVNVRSTSQNSLRTRPGYTPNFITGGNPVTDIRAYTTLGTDDAPRFLARDSLNGIYLDNGVLQATLGGTVGHGVSMMPFRPGASPQSWMYIAGYGDYKKFSAPGPADAVTVQKVGIAEPQTQIEAATNAPTFTSFQAAYASWTNGGTAGSPASGNIISDTAGAAILADPIVASRISIQVGLTYYTPGMLLTVNGSALYPVEEVWQACAACTISAIRYDSGTSGYCAIVSSLDLSDTLGRGSLISLNSSETVLILSVTSGDNGTCMIRCKTTGTHAAAETITGITAIVLHGTVATGNSLVTVGLQSSITAGTATLSEAISAGVFAAYGQNDYIHVTLLLSDIAAVSSVTFVFNVGPTVDYVTNILTYTVYGSALAPLLLAGEVVEVHFPISSLSAVPGAINPCNGLQVQVVTTASQTVEIDGLWVGGGGQPDVGDDGAPYQFVAVPRSSLTGAMGNSTPDMRYGVSPRRQSVTLTVPSAAYDTQIDTWDYYATGGTITGYGYVGSVSVGATSFTFNLFDTAIAAAIADGKSLQIDNYEPWPSIDVPWMVSAATITVVGSYLTVTGPTVWPATIAKWLPGTLITLSGFQTFTLRARPVQLALNSYLFQLEECVGSESPTTVTVTEPDVANQALPYVWGPDAYGVCFANGDPNRPGTQYFTKAYFPDAAPQQNTLELISPDRPLIGGVVMAGVSICASSAKWWALYPNQSGSIITEGSAQIAASGTGGYTPVEWPVGRTPVSPWMATDGTAIFFWARDGICKTSGSGYQSLTDEDLYGLFPREGVPGKNVVRWNATYYAPDYSRVATFRLAIYNGFLYADYQDSTGTQRTLVCDLHSNSWCQDIYGAQITCRYGIDQQAAALIGNPTLYTPLMMGDAGGNIYSETDLHNDNLTPITAGVQTFEFDGGDQRAFDQWGDLYLDSLPASGITATPLSLGAAIAGVPVTNIPAASSRTFTPVSCGGSTIQNTLGIGVSWTDDFTKGQGVTHVYLWQPSFVPWPILTQADSPWMSILPGGAAAFLQGLLVPMETGGQLPQISIRTDLTSTPIQLTATRTPLANVKTPIPFSLASPIICHQVQIVRGFICRIWLDEVTWVAEATPELALTWATQPTAHGQSGYHSILRIEASYLATAPVTLNVAVYDGSPPAAIALPSTGGVKQRVLLTPTFNKGQLFTYSAVSTAAFQIYLPEWTFWIGAWGRKGPAIPYRMIGGSFDDKAAL